jgi:hypothetical protein
MQENPMPQIVEGVRLSPQQKHAWSLQADQPGTPYAVRGLIRLEGPLDRQRLAQALERVVAEHEILRTAFRHLPGVQLPLQVVSAGAVRWAADADLSDSAPAAQEAEIAARWREFRPAADLAAGVLLDAGVLRLAADRHLLLLGASALCADAATLPIIMAAAARAYAPPAGEQDETIQYADLSEIFNDLLEAEDTKMGRDYWVRQRLSSVAPFALPGMRPAGGAPWQPARQAIALGPELARALGALAAEPGRRS